MITAVLMFPFFVAICLHSLRLDVAGDSVCSAYSSRVTSYLPRLRTWVIRQKTVHRDIVIVEPRGLLHVELICCGGFPLYTVDWWKNNGAW